VDDLMLVTVGVDTHTDVHVAAVLDPAGRLLETKAFPATTRGYAQLATWAESFGQVDKVGMEGTGSFGAGLLRFLADYGLMVIEVDRPDRADRRRNGKSDPLDAESAARAVQSGRATGTPKSRDGGGSLHVGVGRHDPVSPAPATRRQGAAHFHGDWLYPGPAASFGLGLGDDRCL
jgi:Transposase